MHRVPKGRAPSGNVDTRGKSLGRQGGQMDCRRCGRTRSFAGTAAAARAKEDAGKPPLHSDPPKPATELFRGSMPAVSTSAFRAVYFWPRLGQTHCHESLLPVRGVAS
jgi:hypothetical protein